MFFGSEYFLFFSFIHIHNGRDYTELNFLEIYMYTQRILHNANRVYNTAKIQKEEEKKNAHDCYAAER